MPLVVSHHPAELAGSEKSCLLGKASIASGYTPDAGSAKGAPPPQPLKGCQGQGLFKIVKREKHLLEKRKTAIITARMTPGIKDIIQHLSEKAGMTVTDYLITCALGKEIIRVDGLDEILSELKSQGRNLNQLTTLANMGRLTLLNMDDLLDAYGNLYWQVEKLCERVK